MKIETHKIPEVKEFEPFSVTFTFDKKEDWEDTMKSLLSDGLAGDGNYKTISEIPSFINKRAEIYYAFKCKGAQ